MILKVERYDKDNLFTPMNLIRLNLICKVRFTVFSSCCFLHVIIELLNIHHRAYTKVTLTAGYKLSVFENLFKNCLLIYDRMRLVNIYINIIFFLLISPNLHSPSHIIYV